MPLNLYFYHGKTKNVKIMKKNWILMLMLLAGVISMTSCSKDDNNEPTDLSPTLTLQVGTDYVYQNTSVTVGTPLKIGVRAISNATSGKKLVNFTLVRTFNNLPATVVDSTFSESTFSVDYLINANLSAGPETFLLTIKDKDGLTATQTLTITTTALTGEINSYSMKLMGAQHNSNGSSFASVDGNVYTMANAKANANKIDWLYFYGATDLATIAAPNDAHAAQVYTDATNGLAHWPVLNATKFKLITDAVDFNAIADDGVIVTQTATGVTETRIPSLATDKLIAFVTASGKKGIIKVESITTGDTGSMTISVKVQK